MKKVLIVIPSFDIGGTIVSLKSLIEHVDYNMVQIDIYARSISGPYMDKFNKVKILKENIWLASDIKQSNILKRIIFIFFKRLRNILGLLGINLYPIYSYFGGKQIGSDKYDAVISYQEDLNRVVCYYPAKKRIGWIHCDYQRYLNLIGKNDEEKFYQRFDYIVCVSKFAQKTFCNVHPKFQNKTKCIYNLINVRNIRNKASEKIDLDSRFCTSVFTIVSIGRLDPIKQFHLIPTIARIIIDRYGDNFKWYIIGGTNHSTVKTSIEKEIVRNNVSNCVICLGEKSNIYPYLKHANLLVHTSASESFSLVVHEAMALEVPFVLNDIDVAREIMHKNSGIIADIKSMPEIIHKVINNEFKFCFHSLSQESTLKIFYSMI